MTRRFQDFDPLWPAEQRLVDWIRAGNMEACPISESLPPEDAPEDVKLRASLIRYLALGGCDECRVPEKGLGVIGAYIAGDGKSGAETLGLDLESSDLPSDLRLFRCRIPDLLLLRSASLRNLYLDGSHLHTGLSADGLEAKGGVFLRWLGARGGVRLLGARLGGNLDCEGARLTAGAGGEALSADGLEAKGDVFLRGLEAQGEVRLLGAKLGGNLDCEGARLTAGDGDRALTVSHMRVEGSFLLRAGARVDGVLDLTGSEIGHHNDDPACWPRHGYLVLNRCRYGAFAGKSPVDAASRMRWLSLQDEARWGAKFWPQPWEECARVLRAMGYDAAARTILIEKERRQRAVRLHSASREWRVLGPLVAFFLIFWGSFLDWTVRYGRQPAQVFISLALVWCVGWSMFSLAEARGDLKPKPPEVQRGPEWVLCGFDVERRRFVPSMGRIANGRRAVGQTQLDCFLNQPEASSYPAFNAALYSADTLFQVVTFEMQEFWLPDERGQVGRIARWYLWWHICAGWLLSILAIAGFSGLIKTDNTR